MAEYPPLLALVLALVLGTAAVECTPRVPPVSPLHNASDDLLRNATRDDRVVGLGRRRLGDGDDGARTYAWNRCFGPATAYAGAWFARLPTARTTRFGDSLGMEYHDYNLFHEVQSHFCVCVCDFVCSWSKSTPRRTYCIARSESALAPQTRLGLADRAIFFSIFVCCFVCLWSKSTPRRTDRVARADSALAPQTRLSLADRARARARSCRSSFRRFYTKTLSLSSSRPRGRPRPAADRDEAARAVRGSGTKSCVRNV